ncbi:hypothetical protein EDD18DRAFT_1361784 [Armillaria luteobubalina]|uniref:Uncharacterized protein n=1 Tax=Armillaria luteobubalina TaxID=153913 RepID=A0AA39PHK4_9AGAR|nr:hypothetical protein EDD18DRAFT_1361784 [Armillaria luteobubalina]
MLEAAIHFLPKKHFRGESYYTDILEPFGDDVQDRDRASHIFTYCDLQTAYYSFYLPVALAVYMFRVCQSYPSGTQTIEPYNLPKYILVPVDEYSQIQNDCSTFLSHLSRSGRPSRISWITGARGA